ncbi:hypothetical protein HNS38_18945, partial [Lentimicrobium sp. L6]
MKKISISIIIIVFNLLTYAQSFGDDWNYRAISTYNSDEEVARVSLTLSPGFNTANHNNFVGYIDPDLPLNGGVSETDGEFNMNYVRVYHPLKDNSTQIPPVHDQIDYHEWKETINYFDGIGRPIQTVNVKASSYDNDIIQPTIYDEFGRVKKEYLSYAIAQDGENGPGGFRSNAVEENSEYYHNYFSTGDGFSAFADKEFDGSPLDRVVKQGSPGAAWQLSETSGHFIEYKYLSNSSSAETFPILKVEVGNLVNSGEVFSTNTLFKTITIDEDGNENVDYKDFENRVIVKCGEENTKTYYVFDDLGLLRYIVPTLAALKCNGSSVPTEDEINALCYYYEYDHRNRMILKKLPGASPVYLVYNKRDQLILSQDGNQRPYDKWSFTKYDVFNRPIINGVCTIPSTTVNDIRTTAMSSASYEDFETNTGFNNTAYSNTTYPILSSQDEIHTVNYYDSYQVLDILYTDNIYKFADDELDFLHLTSGEANTEVIGLPTVSSTKVLLNDSETVIDDLLLSVTYYNIYEQAIQKISDNHLGGVDIVSYKVNYTGDIIESIDKHILNDQETKIRQLFYYNQNKLLTSSLHSVNNSYPVATVNKYNELGQLSYKSLHANMQSENAIQQIDYDYNIRGWMIGINNPNSLGDDLFAMQLDYNTASNQQFNGNIGAISWASETFDDIKTYDFVYDGLNRIEASVYQNNGLYNTTYTYDANGNIETLGRYMDIGGVAQEIDLLDYDYNGNQLLSVNDQFGDYFENYGFKDNGVFNAVEYLYDDNGNMESDDNKGIENIAYNHLNLPISIQFNNDKAESKSIGYIYTANGTKLRKHTHDGSKESIITDYVGAYVYENTTLQFIQTREGRLVPNESGGYNYEYALQDHLGNTRVMFNEEGEVLQDQSYYPFGMSMGEALTYNDIISTPENKYLYNGKELQDDFGLDWYEYGFRFYDPQLARFPSLDPVADKFAYVSPFNYAENSPISNIDLWGLQAVSSIIAAAMHRDNPKLAKDAEYLKGSQEAEGLGIILGATAMTPIASSTVGFFVRSAPEVYGETRLLVALTPEVLRFLSTKNPRVVSAFLTFLNSIKPEGEVSMPTGLTTTESLILLFSLFDQGLIGDSRIDVKKKLKSDAPKSDAPKPDVPKPDVPKPDVPKP